MTLLGAIEICAFLVIAYGIVTQLVLPLFHDKPMLPYITMRKQRKLERHLADLRQRRREQELRDNIVEENDLTINLEQQRIEKLLQESQRRENNEKQSA